ncbi:MAG: DUF493 domain-containing protein [Epsilonproteobacteria bacterium]|nr:DUF493 domain-containing protein [Campylobacterota bacterium]NPA56987.1 DUF493 domain-containing protein [Campylobacterota bacterium]
MKELKDFNQKVHIEYPTIWRYKVIGEDAQKTRKAIESVTKRPTTITFSKQSNRGKYQSFNADIMVHSEEEREQIYRDLKGHKDIKMVL